MLDTNAEVFVPSTDRFRFRLVEDGYGSGGSSNNTPTGSSWRTRQHQRNSKNRYYGGIHHNSQRGSMYQSPRGRINHSQRGSNAGSFDYPDHTHRSGTQRHSFPGYHHQMKQSRSDDYRLGGGYHHGGDGRWSNLVSHSGSTLNNLRASDPNQNKLRL
eukprot:UN28818